MKKKGIIKELKEHVPFTFFAVLIAIFVIAVILYYFKKDISEEFFHILHPLHVLASAMVTAGIYYKYKNDPGKAVMIGIIGAIAIGSLSDIIFPYLGGLIFNLNTEFHLPLFETPLIIILSAIFGCIIGISSNLTKFPHFIHVFISVFASLFYLLTFSPDFSILYFTGTFLIVFISVIIPCCLSDIIFPFLFLKK